jgi:cytochrome o ubiquinol oxidase operon protein cyoD
MPKRALLTYIAGFLLSIFSTLLAFNLVTKQILTSGDLVFTILLLAIIQLTIQIIFFLHLGLESAPRWNLAVLISTVSIILILVIGSLVIMENLDYRHMPTDIEIMEDEAIHK